MAILTNVLNNTSHYLTSNNNITINNTKKIKTRSFNIQISSLFEATYSHFLNETTDKLNTKRDLNKHLTVSTYIILFILIAKLQRVIANMRINGDNCDCQRHWSSGFNAKCPV